MLKIGNDICHLTLRRMGMYANSVIPELLITKIIKLSI